MTCLHCLDVGDQGPREEDAEDLKPKPKVSGVNKGRGRGAGGDCLCGFPSPTLPGQSAK